MSYEDEDIGPGDNPTGARDDKNSAGGNRASGTSHGQKSAEKKVKKFFKEFSAKYPPAYADIGVVENSIGVNRRTGKVKEISVAEEAARNEFGDPSRNVPARPFLEMTANENIDQWDDEAASLLQNKQGSRSVIETIAILARDAVKEKISTGEGRAPNAPLTVLIKGRNQPLVDFGDLLNSISYEIHFEDLEEDEG